MPKEYETLNQLDAEVLFVLMMHRGENNAIQRWSLIKRIYGDDVETDEIDNNNLYDRAVRNSIQRLRESGQHICNRGNGAATTSPTAATSTNASRNTTSDPHTQNL